MKRWLSLVLLSFALATTPACARIQLHPGAINSFDSTTYDVLISAKATIDAARPQFAAKQLPDSLKPAFNLLVSAYDVAYPVFLSWHDATAKGLPADKYLFELNKDIADLTRAIANFTGGK